LRHLDKSIKQLKIDKCFAPKEKFRKVFEIDIKEGAAAFIKYFKELMEENGIPVLQFFN
jgi:transposase